MKIELFHPIDLLELYQFIVETIQVSYFGYYPKEAIDHFIDYSNTTDILDDAKHHYICVIKRNGRIVATGTLRYTHVKRVFVHPDWQGKGLGKVIMQDLEQQARKNDLPLIELHSSLFAKPFYDSQSYKMFHVGKVKVANDEVLYYQRMAKRIDGRVSATHYQFHKKKFRVITNDGLDAEVTTDTEFNFFQNEELLYAEYKGGRVRYGEIFGLIENDSIHFYYSQINLEGGKNQGSSIDHIKVLDNNRLQLIDRWKWKNKSGEGLCILEEIGDS